VWFITLFYIQLSSILKLFYPRYHTERVFLSLCCLRLTMVHSSSKAWLIETAFRCSLAAPFPSAEFHDFSYWISEWRLLISHHLWARWRCPTANLFLRLNLVSTGHSQCLSLPLALWSCANLEWLGFIDVFLIGAECWWNHRLNPAFWPRSHWIQTGSGRPEESIGPPRCK